MHWRLLKENEMLSVCLLVIYTPPNLLVSVVQLPVFACLPAPPSQATEDVLV